MPQLINLWVVKKLIISKRGGTFSMKQNSFKKPYKTTKILPEFSSTTLTNYAGLIPFGQFLFEKLGFAKRVSSGIDIPLHHNTVYHTAQILGTLILGYLGGFTRLKHFEEFSKDRVIQTLLQLPRTIDENTFAHRLKKFTFKAANQVQTILGEIGHLIHRNYPPAQATVKKIRKLIDLDSTVKIAYGHQEGAAKGYNDKRRGAKSYHPLLAFYTGTKEVVHSWFRPGNTYTGNGASEFLKEVWTRLPHGEDEYLFRADSGFFSEAVLRVLEEFKALYLIKVKLRNIKHLISQCKWQTIPGENEIYYAEMDYHCHSWKKARKFVFIRKLVHIHQEGLLFPIEEYTYYCFVTNLEEAPIELYHVYKDRGECENWIDAVTNQLGAGVTLVDHFWANDVLWTLAVFAYNLTIWLRYLTDSNGCWHQEPVTFRNWFIRVAGKLIYHGRQFTLKLQKDYFYRKPWEMIYTNLCQLQLE